MSVKHLKVKIKTLANEARDIRAEEKKLKVLVRSETQTIGSYSYICEVPVPGKEWGLKNLFERRELHFHRVVPLRKAARHNYLAYGFLRGRKYSQIEQAAYTKPDYEEILKLVLRFKGDFDGDIRQKFAEWFDEGIVVRTKSFERKNRRDNDRAERQRIHLEKIRSMTQEQINEERAKRKAEHFGSR